MDDEVLLDMIRVAVAQGTKIPQALDMLNLQGEQRDRLQSAAEAELGLEIDVGPGICLKERGPWVDDQDIDWFHWGRIRRLWIQDGKLPVGAIRTIDKTTHTILDNMPPPGVASFDWKGMIVGSPQVLVGPKWADVSGIRMNAAAA